MRQEVTGPSITAPKRVSRQAIASFIFGILFCLSLLSVYFGFLEPIICSFFNLLAIIGSILGGFAIWRIVKEKKLKGIWLAITGILFTCVTYVLPIVLV